MSLIEVGKDHVFIVQGGRRTESQLLDLIKELEAALQSLKMQRMSDVEHSA